MDFQPTFQHHETPQGSMGAPSQPVTASPPPAPVSQPLAMASDGVRPVPVVRVLSPFGIEYVFMTICLFAGAIALIAALISLVNGKTDFSVLALPAAVLLVTVPVFGFFFLRLKKLELDRPELKLDPSKRRSTQATQIVAFLTVLFTLIGFIFDIFMKIGGQGGPTVVKAGLDGLCLLVVAGGILYYYWRDEHKQR